MKLFVRITATYFLIIGLVSLIVPQGASGQLGHALGPFDIFAARSLGVTLLTVALLDLSASSQTGSFMIGVLGANFLMNFALCIIDGLAILAGTIGRGSWIGIGIHVILAIGFMFFLIAGARQARALRKASR